MYEVCYTWVPYLYNTLHNRNLHNISNKPMSIKCLNRIAHSSSCCWPKCYRIATNSPPIILIGLSWCRTTLPISSLLLFSFSFSSLDSGFFFFFEFLCFYIFRFCGIWFKFVMFLWYFCKGWMNDQGLLVNYLLEFTLINILN